MQSLDPTGPTAPPGLLAARIRTACLVVLALYAFGAALVFLRPLLTPLLISLFLFYLIKPLTDQMARWPISPLISYTVLALLLGLLFLLIGHLFYRDLAQLQQRMPRYRAQLQDLGLRLKHFLPQQPHGEPNAEGEEVQEGPITLATLLEAFAMDTKQLVEYAFGTAFHFVEVVVLVVFYLLYTFMESYKLPRRIAERIHADVGSKYLEIGRNIEESIKRFLWLKTLTNLGIAATTGLCCYLFGLDLWFFWTMLMFVANYVTYLGSMVAILPPILLGYLQFSNPVAATALAALLIGNRFLWVDYLELRLLGKHLNLSPLLLLFSIAFFGYIWGTVGMLLAVPMLTSVKLVLNHFESTRSFAVLLSEE